VTGEHSARTLLFDYPATYQITVRGWLDPNWSDRLEGMTVSLDAVDEEEPICTLEGELMDQAALVGILVALYELHLPILLVKCLTCQPADKKESNETRLPKHKPVKRENDKEA
jgi:hypothetical protein